MAEAYLMAWWIIFNDTEATSVKWPVAKQWEQTFVKGTEYIKHRQ